MPIRFLFAVLCVVGLAGCLAQHDEGVQYYNCGETPIKTVKNAEGLTFLLDDEVYELVQNQGEDGTFFSTQAPNPMKINFTPNQGTAVLEINDEERPLCRKVVWKNAKDVASYRAYGNEPAWLVELGTDIMQIKRGYDGKMEVFERPKAKITRNGRRYETEAFGKKIIVNIKHQPQGSPCRDIMSGQFFADSVRLSYGDEVYEGCGDTSPYLEIEIPELHETVWQVEDIDGEGIIDRSNLTLSFDATGRLSGSSGCNRYAADYEMMGSRLKINEMIATTRRACMAEAMGNQEAKFLELLPNMRRVAFQLDGGLVLSNAQGQNIIFRAY